MYATFPQEDQQQLERSENSSITEYNPEVLSEASSPTNNPIFVSCQHQSHKTQHSLCDIYCISSLVETETCPHAPCEEYKVFNLKAKTTKISLINLDLLIREETNI